VLKDYFRKVSFVLSRFPSHVTGCGGHDFVLLCCIFESIKNPNKTAVKLFLLPYDLTRMEPGTKSSIRQRCFSKEPTDDVLVKSTETDLVHKLNDEKKIDSPLPHPSQYWQPVPRPVLPLSAYRCDLRQPGARQEGTVAE
jgi:hypothetical protein